MKEENFENLREQIKGNNTLERLSSYGNLLENIVDYIVTSKINNNDINFLLESIKNQKKIYEFAEKLYEEIQSEEINRDKCEDDLNELKVACSEYKDFYEGHNTLTDN
ncbi:hypothetical protein CWI38_1459p0050 [Hamiltosporidium tvaerminnensis]|uniref:Uncharacterized protein n=1 Tax=Hamiltosporidium tvaerminnensis TaxID=1176355 RepID=A0A4Q9LQT3_9MICR|nr:hypothetical protein CWI38_1479p0020 [Hamiltosporidium tvaerminnensis]TBU10957.1 hypothetical protein CWI38_1459p0050 [Hamiltosporidium tvaerminnensis]